MRRVGYSVASCMDGQIAGPFDEYGRIPVEPGIDFGAFLETRRRGWSGSRRRIAA